MRKKSTVSTQLKPLKWAKLQNIDLANIYFSFRKLDSRIELKLHTFYQSVMDFEACVEKCKKNTTIHFMLLLNVSRQKEGEKRIITLKRFVFKIHSFFVG